MTRQGEQRGACPHQEALHSTHTAPPTQHHPLHEKTATKMAQNGTFAFRLAHHRRMIRASLTVVVLVGGMLVAGARTFASAATIAVDRFDDPALPTASACAGADSDCSLRGALAFADLSNNTTITLVYKGFYDSNLGYAIRVVDVNTLAAL